MTVNYPQKVTFKMSRKIFPTRPTLSTCNLYYTKTKASKHIINIHYIYAVVLDIYYDS